MNTFAVNISQVLDMVNSEAGLVPFVAATTAFVLSTRYQQSSPAKVTVAASSLKLKDIVQYVILPRNPYYPTFFSVIFDYHGQLQTVFQFITRTLLSKILPLRRRRELLTLEDGALVALDWMSLSCSLDTERQGGDERKRLVVISHGLCGSAKSDYIAHISDVLLRSGYEVVVMIRRGCAGLPIPTPTTMFPHRNNPISDLGQAVVHIMKERPDVNIFGLGYSMGAAHWLKELGAMGNDPWFRDRVRAAVCVCPPWNMARHTKVFHWWSPLLAFGLKYHLSKHIPTLRELGVDFSEIRKSTTIESLNVQLTSVYGYSSVEEYMSADSPVHAAYNIHIPTLSISAEDDPVCCVTGCPEESTVSVDSGSANGKIGPGLVVLKSAYGGHLAFPSALRDPQHPVAAALSLGSYLQCTWTDGVIIDWFESFSK